MNRLQRYLDEVGVPWRESRAGLAARFGVRRCTWSLAEVVEVEARPPPLPGLLRPLQFRDEPFRCQQMPPTYFSGYADPCGEAIRNLEAVAATVAAQLGPGAYEDHTVNARSYVWRAGPARLQLHAFPPRLQDRRTRNEWHLREPRLRVACLISIDTGYRPPLGDEERAWVDGFTPALTLHPGLLPPAVRAPQPAAPGWLDRLFGARPRPAPAELGPSWANPVQAYVGNLRADETGLEYVREPPPSVERVFGRLACSPRREALVWCDHQLRIAPLRHAQALRLDRYEPERGIGDGEALLVLRCRPPGGDREVDVPVARRDGMDSLDGLARQVAEWSGLPLERRDVW